MRVIITIDTISTMNILSTLSRLNTMSTMYTLNALNAMNAMNINTISKKRTIMNTINTWSAIVEYLLILISCCAHRAFIMTIEISIVEICA